jgi:AraC-like DNA-binding protein
MSNRTPTIATKMRYFAGSFWTPDTDTRLQRLEAQGLSAAKIAAKLGVSRNSVIARSQRLRGLSRTFPSYLREQEKARARILLLRRGEACLAPIETPELCKVPGLQRIMAAADARLSEARGCSTLRPCCIASGTQAPQPVIL